MSFLMAGQANIQTGAPAPATMDPEQWVKRHADELFRHALARVCARETAEDLVQETFLAAWKSRASFAGRSSEKTWLLQILKNKIADYYRSTAREIDFADMEALAEFEASQFQAGLLGNAHWARTAAPMSWRHVRQSVENAEFWDTVHRCAHKLPEKTAQVFLLREIEQWESEQICERLKINRTHLYVMLHRARLALRRCLERNWFRNSTDKFNQLS